LLAALTQDDAPVAYSEGDAAVFFDRDWWVFRYILDYLRTGELPQKKSLLREMYIESEFYELPMMREEIENKIDDFSLLATSTSRHRMKQDHYEADHLHRNLERVRGDDDDLRERGVGLYRGERDVYAPPPSGPQGGSFKGNIFRDY
jgi:hypothetical protein